MYGTHIFWSQNVKKNTDILSVERKWYEIHGSDIV